MHLLFFKFLLNYTWKDKDFTRQSKVLKVSLIYQEKTSLNFRLPYCSNKDRIYIQTLHRIIFMPSMNLSKIMMQILSEIQLTNNLVIINNPK
jgi:uncharacterized membrane protein YfbV (UPF0208 family)